MPLYMDVHRNMKGMTEDDVAKAHKKDLELQKKHNVRFVRYWADPKQGAIFCLSEAPNREAPMAVHKEAGHPTDEIYEVQEGR